MKLTELIQEYEFSLSTNAETALRSVDWNYDVDPFDSKRFDRGQKAMKEAQAHLKQLYNKSPEAAEQLWAKHNPYGEALPSWVLV